MYIYLSQPEDAPEPYWIFSGKDKFENDLLIKYGYKELKHHWFHADKYSSAHIYLKLHNEDNSINDVPKSVIQDCLQLCKAESIQGNKLPECRIVHTPWTNLRKAGYMNPGEVSFKAASRCTRTMCFQRDNAVLARLKKTRIEISGMDLPSSENLEGEAQNKEQSLEKFLHNAKKSKDGDYIINFVKINQQRLVELELKKKQKQKELKQTQSKSKKQKKKDEEDAWLNDDISDL